MSKMKYFVSYSEVFSRDNQTKKESLRLQTYNLLIKFLSRKQIPNNHIIEEFNKFKNYFESKEFTNVYLLSPFIINENKFVKNIYKLITLSGESNSYNSILKDIQNDVEEIKRGASAYKTNYMIKVDTADNYLEKYYKSPELLTNLVLESEKENNILFEISRQGFTKKDNLLSLLYLKLRYDNLSKSEDVESIIKDGEELIKVYPYYTYYYLLGMCYDSPYCNRENKTSKALEYFIKGSEQNDTNCIYMAGLHYFMGLGTSKDVLKARDYFEKGAKLNDIDCSSCLGIYYLSINDKEKAKPYIEDSASKGDYKALLLLDTDFREN